MHSRPGAFGFGHKKPNRVGTDTGRSTSTRAVAENPTLGMPPTAAASSRNLAASVPESARQSPNSKDNAWISGHRWGKEGVLPFKVCKVATEGAENPNGMLLIVTVKYYDTQIDIRQRLSRRQPKRDVNDDSLDILQLHDFMFSKDIKSYGDLVGEWAFRPHSGKPWRFVDRQLMEQDKDWVLLWPPQVHTTTKLARRVKHAEKRATAP